MSGPLLKSHRDSTQLDDRNLKTQLQTSHPWPAYHERSLRGWQLVVLSHQDEAVAGTYLAGWLSGCLVVSSSF